MHVFLATEHWADSHLIAIWTIHLHPFPWRPRYLPGSELLHFLIETNICLRSSSLPALLGNDWWCKVETTGTGRRLEVFTSNFSNLLPVPAPSTIRQQNIACVGTPIAVNAIHLIWLLLASARGSLVSTSSSTSSWRTFRTRFWFLSLAWTQKAPLSYYYLYK